ncbi:hypothetical protein [Pedobacter sp. Hv1]|nr:hypothetical protein [Pedobacter sp. Hv1]
MENTVYYEVSPGVRIGLPKTLPSEEVEKRICRYQENLERNKLRTLNGTN